MTLIVSRKVTHQRRKRVAAKGKEKIRAREKEKKIEGGEDMMVPRAIITAVRNSVFLSAAMDVVMPRRDARKSR